MIFKNKLLFSLFFITLALASQPSVYSSEIDNTHVSEQMGFKINNIRIHHQDFWRTLNLSLEYSAHKEMTPPDTLAIKDSLKQFLHDYSNPKDYWEIMNVNLVHFLTQKYPSLDFLKIQIAVVPDQPVPFCRKSIVTYMTGKNLQEEFEFRIENDPLFSSVFKDVTMRIVFKYIENPQVFDYPDFLWINDTVKQFLIDHQQELSQWDTIRPILEKQILEKYQGLTNVDIPVCITNKK